MLDLHQAQGQGLGRLSCGQLDLALALLVVLLRPAHWRPVVVAQAVRADLDLDLPSPASVCTTHAIQTTAARQTLSCLCCPCPLLDPHPLLVKVEARLLMLVQLQVVIPV